jgi:Cu(I)/Ag(I) efflux system membrane protein CusA/SilA
MPVTVPRASVTQTADDLKARDALLRGFPEVESVIGKSGRADTPTDPAPLDMVETFVNYRPRDLWPKRVLRYDDAERQTRAVLTALEKQGFILQLPKEEEAEWKNLVVDATQKALERFDEPMRELALLRYHEFEQELGPLLTRFAVTEAIRQIEAGTKIEWPAGKDQQTVINELSATLTPKYGVWLSEAPALEDLIELSSDVGRHLRDIGAIEDPASALELKPTVLGQLATGISELLGGKHATFSSVLFDAVESERLTLWREQVQKINWELFDRGTEIFTWYAIEELLKGAQNNELLAGADKAEESKQLIAEAANAQLDKKVDQAAFKPFQTLREELEKPFRQSVFLWPRKTGPKGDLVDDEMGRVLQVPGWSNIFTQPIINRIEMLSTGVRTDIGVKVFGPDLDTIERVGREIEAALKPVNGARDVIAAPFMGKGYLQIDIDRIAAARYGISVEDIQNEIEVALAGRALTYTVEKRERFPVRVRYARANRDDEESIRRLLISSDSGMSSSQGMTGDATGGASSSMASGSAGTATTDEGAHSASPAHSSKGKRLIPLKAVANVQIVEGPAMIKSENGRLLNYVTLNVRGRDIVGFVDEAQRVVGQKVKLPEGVHIEWSGEFEHQVRAARTLRFVFPAVIVLIFVILYLTYHDLADAALMMLAVPEALAGGAFFMFLFPKIMQGWDAPPMDFSVAVWVGFIACFGMATETGIIMLVYLREAIAKRGGLENIHSLDELRQAVIEGAVHRLRPKLLTEGVAIIAIFPMVFAKGVGGEILAPMALPVLGGLLISDEVVDLFLPVRFYWVRRARWLRMQREGMTKHE